MFDLKLKDLKRILNDYVQKNNAFPLSMDALINLISEDYKTKNINVEVNFASYSQTREHCTYLLEYLLLNSNLFDDNSFSSVNTHQKFPAFRQMVRSTRKPQESSNQTILELGKHTSHCSVQGIYANLAAAEASYVNTRQNPASSANNTQQYENMFNAATKAFEYSKQLNSSTNLIYIIDVVERIPQKSFQHFKLLAEIQGYRARNINYQNQDNESYRDCILGMIKYHSLALDSCSSSDDKTKATIVRRLADIYRSLEHKLPMNIVRDKTIFWDFISEYRQEIIKLKLNLSSELFRELSNAYGFNFQVFLYGLKDKSLLVQNKAFLKKQLLEMLPILTIDLIANEKLITEEYTIKIIAQHLVSIATSFMVSTDITDLSIAQQCFFLARKFLGTSSDLKKLGDLYLEGQIPLLEGETREVNAAECYTRAMSASDSRDSDRIAAIEHYRAICSFLPPDKCIDLTVTGQRLVSEKLDFMQKYSSFSDARAETWIHVFQTAILTGVEPSIIQEHLRREIKPDFTLPQQISAKVMVWLMLHKIIAEMKHGSRAPQHFIQIYSQFADSLKDSFFENLKGIYATEYEAVQPLIDAFTNPSISDNSQLLIKLDGVFLIRMIRTGVIENDVKLLTKIRDHIYVLYGRNSARHEDINEWVSRATSKASNVLLLGDCMHLSAADPRALVSFRELENIFLETEQHLQQTNDSNIEEILFNYIKIAIRPWDQWGMYPQLALQCLKKLRDQCAAFSTSFTTYQQYCIRFYFKATLFVVDRPQFERDIGRIHITNYYQVVIANNLVNNNELTHEELKQRIILARELLHEPSAAPVTPRMSATDQGRSYTNATLVPPPSLAFFSITQKNPHEVSATSGPVLATQISAKENDKDLLIQQLQNEIAELRAKYTQLEGEKNQLQERFDQHLTAVDSFYKHSLSLRPPISISKAATTTSGSNLSETATVEKKGCTL